MKTSTVNLNRRSLLMRAALVAALLGGAFGLAVFGALASDDRVARTPSAPFVVVPLIALPVLHALLHP